VRNQWLGQDVLDKLARRTSEAVGSPLTSIVVVTLIIVWAITGPAVKFSDPWQLVIHTGKSIVSFLMFFLIQNSQNRDSKAIQIKLDELIRAMDSARDEIIDVETSSEQELKQLKRDFSKLSDQAKS
jgi:low affinity Fe/Cu permease